MDNNELYHHGIKGQRWGVRRYQKSDGTLTAAGKKRYENEENKSSHRLKLEAKYKSLGMNDQEASERASKRIKAEKFVAVVAGVTAAAAIATVAYKHYDKTVDKYIKSDTILKRVTADGEAKLNDAFYAAKKKSDTKRYVGLFGNALRGNERTPRTVYQKSIRATDKIKVASEKSATKVLSDLMAKDSDFKKQAIEQIQYARGGNQKQRRVLTKGLAALKNGRVNSNAYRALNYTLAGNTSDVASKFYDSMRKAGYDAVGDINDRKLSGYNAKSATIFFNKAKTVVSDVREIPAKEICRQNRIEYGKIIAKGCGTYGLTLAGVAGALTIKDKVSSSQQNDAFVRQYKETHPNTKLSYNQILKKKGDK